ncbi:hypothetical protein K1Y78_07435 [Streptomyces sp. tea 10]|nr:hypothetical protein [Streptomyces sp. tea 10]
MTVVTADTRLSVKAHGEGGLARAECPWLELGLYGLLPTDPEVGRDEFARRGTGGLPVVRG